VEVDMEVVVEDSASGAVEAEAAASVAEGEVEVAEAVAAAGEDAREDARATGFALMRGAFRIACSSISVILI
jgi:hypothetical protein